MNKPQPQREPALGKFFSAVARGAQAMGEAPAGERYIVAGKSVTCQHCSHDRFVEGRALLNTAGMSFFNLDWANRSAATLTCTACGRIEWFLADPEERA
jgi:hypothetical protein